MTPIALSDEALAEVMNAASTIAPEQRDLFLQEVARQLAGQTVGAGLAHRVAYRVAAELSWDTNATRGVG